MGRVAKESTPPSKKKNQEKTKTTTKKSGTEALLKGHPPSSLLWDPSQPLDDGYNPTLQCMHLLLSPFPLFILSPPFYILQPSCSPPVLLRFINYS